MTPGKMRDEPIAALEIAGRAVGPGHPIFVVAEIGINHNGSVDSGRRLIDAAVAAGASAVKFQKRQLTNIYTRSVLSELEHQEQGFQYLLPILRDFELSPEDLFALWEHCREAEVLFLCTPFDVVSADLLEGWGVPAYKVASADLTDLLLIDRLVEFGKPLLLSTGMSTADEIDSTVAHLRRAGAGFALLHCVSSYPVQPRDARLTRIPELARRHRCPVGYSGHDIGTALSIVAATLGACIIEKHFTLDKTLRGPDHKISLLPGEFERLVASLREFEQAMGERSDSILQGERLNRMVFRKSLVAVRPIVRGERISRDMVAARSPGGGLSPQKLTSLVGRRATRDLRADDPFLPSDLEDRERPDPVPPLAWGRQGFVVRYHDFETVLDAAPQCLEFHLTWGDTRLEVPHAALERNRAALAQVALRVHCCEYVGEHLFDLCSVYDEIVEQSVATLRRVIEVTAELAPYFASDTPSIVFNVGAMTLGGDVRAKPIDPADLHTRIAEQDLAGSRLLAQNMPPNPWYFGGEWNGHYFVRPEELAAFCRATGQGICLDVSHAAMASRYLRTSFRDYVAELRPWVEHIHVADARGLSGEGIQIGTGDVDFAAFFGLFSDYRGTWIPEIWQGHINGNAGAREALRRLASILSRNA